MRQSQDVHHPPKRHRVRFWLSLGFILSLSGVSGCGGCLLCGANVQPTPTRNSGTALIEVGGLEQLAADGATHTVTIGYSGTQQSGGEGTGNSSFSVSRNYEVKPSGVTPAPTVQRYALKPGQWEVKVQQGTWNASCVGQIPSGGTTTFTFQLNQPTGTAH